MLRRAKCSWVDNVKTTLNSEDFPCFFLLLSPTLNDGNSIRDKGGFFICLSKNSSTWDSLKDSYENESIGNEGKRKSFQLTIDHECI